MVRRTLTRGLLAALLVLSSVPLSLGVSASFGEFSAHAQGASIQAIRVEGNKRVEPETIRAYLTFAPGDSYDPAQIDESLKVLFATGLFQDVRIRRDGGTIVVVVVENPIVSRVAFEGNREVEDEALVAEVQLKSRAVYTRARVQADVQRILNVYRRQGLYGAQVDPKIINLDTNRIDVVFEISEGPATKVRAINFIGNSAFSELQLRYIITTSQTNILSFLKGNNIYDQDRLSLDRELLRQFYMKNGYADVRIVSATADLDPGGRGFFITFTIDEGERYRFGTVNVESALPSLNTGLLGPYILVRERKVVQLGEGREDNRGADARRVAPGLRVRPGQDADGSRRVELAPSISSLSSMKARASTSSGSTSSAISAPRIMSSGVNSALPRATPSIACWSSLHARG